MNNEPRANLKGYNKSLNEFGASPKALQWADYRSAALRYRQLSLDIDLTGRSILDVGCGMGDLLPYLYAKSESFSYTGVDINSQFIDIARQRYSNHEFIVMNPFNSDFNHKFDIVVLCGALNANKKDWLERRKAKIRKLFDLANEAVAFNMAGGLVDLSPGKVVAYAKAQDIVSFCTSLTPKIILRANYHPKDFTVTLFK